MHNQYNIPLEAIAKTIGDRHDTVKRLYRGLMVLEQAEREGLFKRDDRWNKRFAYSHLRTGLGYAGVQEFLGLSAEKGFKPDPVPKKHWQDLSDLLLWMYGSKERSKRPLVQSQNPDLRNLDEVLRDQNGKAALRAGLPMEIALKASRGDERLLREALVKGEVALKEAMGLIPTGFRKQNDLFKTAERITMLADSIYEQMNEAVTSDAGRGFRRRKKTK